MLLAVVGEGMPGAKAIPALFTRMSICPSSFRIRSSEACTVGRPGHVAAHADRLAPDEPDLSWALQECTENLNRIIDVVQAHGSRVLMMGLRRWRASLMGEEVVKLLRSA